MELKIIRLLGSDDIIAKVKKNGHRWLLDDPCIIRAVPIQKKEESAIETPNAESQQPNVSFTVMMAPLLQPYMKQGPILIDERQIIFVVDPEAQVIDKYNSLFSPIIVPKLVTS